VYRQHVDFSLANRVPDLEDLTAKRGLANVVRMRSPEEITSWVLHQNGFDWQETNPLRDKIKAHFQIWQEGRITQNASILARLRSSSNGANKFCIAIEFDGNFEGNPGKDNFWKPSKYGRAHVTVAQVMAARRLMRTVHAMLQEVAPGALRAVFAHRQWGVTAKGVPNKPLCPGHEIWTHVGEWAKSEFGYTDGGPGWCYRVKGKDHGIPIPDDWRGVPMADAETAVC